MTKELTLKGLFEEKRCDFEQEMKKFRLPGDEEKMLSFMTEYLNKMLDREGEYRQQLSQSEDYIFRAGIALLNSYTDHNSSLFEKRDADEQSKIIGNNTIIPTAASAATAALTLLGGVAFKSIGAIIAAFISIAGTYLYSNTQTPGVINSTKDNEKNGNLGNMASSIMLDLLGRMDDLMATYRAQTGRIINKYEERGEPTLERNFSPLLHSIQSLAGYRTNRNTTDDNFTENLCGRIDGLVEQLQVYKLSLINYDGSHPEWFETIETDSITEPTPVYPAIVKEEQIVIRGRIFCPKEKQIEPIEKQ